MKKYLFYIFLSFFYFNISNASYEGYGPLKLNATVVKYFKEYLDVKKIHNKNLGSERHGKGWFFFIAESGEEFGYVYCPQGKQCVMDQIPFWIFVLSQKYLSFLVKNILIQCVKKV